MFEPKYKFQLPKIDTYLDPDDNLKIIQDTYNEATKEISRFILNTREQQIREKLIELGWTHPEDKYMGEL